MVKGGADVREKKEINVKTGNQIRIARESAGLTQDRFAEMVSLATKNVLDIEPGVVGSSVGTLVRICETLSISSDSIRFGEQGQGLGGYRRHPRLSHRRQRHRQDSVLSLPQHRVRPGLRDVLPLYGHHGGSVP